MDDADVAPFVVQPQDASHSQRTRIPDTIVGADTDLESNDDIISVADAITVDGLVQDRECHETPHAANSVRQSYRPAQEETAHEEIRKKLNSVLTNVEERGFSTGLVRVTRWTTDYRDEASANGAAAVAQKKGNAANARLAAGSRWAQVRVSTLLVCLGRRLTFT